MHIRLALIALVALVAVSSHAQELAIGGGATPPTAPRDIWPRATAAAREGDMEGAAARTTELLLAGRMYGVKTFPLYAHSASAMAGEHEKTNPPLAQWASKTAAQLDGNSPSVIFSEAERAAAKNDWGKALPLTLRGYTAVFGNYRTALLARADMLITIIIAVVLTMFVFAVALFIRYFRSTAHDFREVLSARISGGAVSVLAFALLFLPLFLWLGPIWLAFYWLAIFFGYADITERVFIVVLLIVVALLPILTDAVANWIAGVESPVVMAAISSNNQSYQPDALRRLQELIAVVPDNATLHLLMGNMHAFEGLDQQAAVHYERAVALRPNYAGAHVNRGNLHFINNEYQAAITKYEEAQRADPNLAIAYYNHSVAAGDTYKFDQQKAMLAEAREKDRSYVEKLIKNPPHQKIVMYHPPVSEAWAVTREVTKRPAARALFGSYSTFDPARVALNPVTIGALLALILGVLIWFLRRRNGFANACIKCGRTFCRRCKSARESATYCTQCIHIYLKRDGVSLDTKRKKLEEVTDHQAGMVKRNRLFATFLPGSAQLLEGRTITGAIGFFLFALFVAIAVLVGRLAPALGPVADTAQMLVRIAAILLAVITWLVLSLPVYRRRSAA